MAGWFYTDSWNRQYGPVEDAVLLDLNSNGTIHARTTVWRHGMASWEPFFNVAGGLFKKDDQGNPVDLGICAHSGKVVENNEMIPYGSASIEVNAKQEFVQSLMETGRVIEQKESDDGKKYIGFWWRLLGVMLDEMVKYGLMALIMAILAAIFFGTLRYFQMPSAGEAYIGFFLAGAMLVSYGVGAFYEIWMVGKYQGTLGKLVLGARIVQPDDSPISYKRSFARWLAKSPLLVEGVKILPYAMFAFFISLVSSGFKSDSTAFLIASWFLAFALPTILSLALTSVFWMAAFDDQKRALHDRLAATRVVPK